MRRPPRLEKLETSCIQQPGLAAAHVRLRSGAWLCVEASSPSTLCKLLEQVDSAFVESWHFEEAGGTGTASPRTSKAPRLLLLVAHSDWQRAVATARSVNGDLPIVATSSAEQDEPAALDAGADIFCQLPLHWPVFDARVRALLRREAPRQDSGPTGGGPAFRLEPVGRILYVTGSAIALSPREYDLILALSERSEQWVPRPRLLKAMGINHKGYDSSLLRMHVLNIRNKLGGKHWMLQSDRSRGFLLTTSPEHSAPPSSRRAPLKKA